MYNTILITLEATPTDRAIIDHIKALAKLMNSRVALFHVATSAQAQWRGDDAGGEEVRDDQAYLNRVLLEFQTAGIPTETELAYGDPVTEIVKRVKDKGCDLVAMSTHGHKFVADLMLGATASRVQHQVSVPVLMLRSR